MTGVAIDVTGQARPEAALGCVEIGLSAREREVLTFLARTDLRSYDQIGAALHMSAETVRWHTRAIARKLELPEARRELVVAAARERRLLPPAP